MSRWMRWWFNLHRHRPWPGRSRIIHRIERLFWIWPLHAWCYAHRTITAYGRFFHTQKEDE